MAEFTQLKTFAPLRTGGTTTIQVHVTESKAGVRLDIRQWTKSATYDGPTQKGLSLTVTEVKALQAQLADIITFMEEEAK